MEKYIGTKEGFKKYFGGCARNKVQTMTKNHYYKRLGVCECCRQLAELHAAHVGKDRAIIIEDILDLYYKDKKQSNLYNVDIDEFLTLFVNYHEPLLDHFYFLCERCHKQILDNKNAPQAEKDELVRKVMEYRKENPVQAKPINPSKKSKSNTQIIGNKQSNKKLILTSFEMLVTTGKITNNLVKELTDKDFSKKTFGLKYSFLAKVDEIANKDIGHYYSKVFVLDGNEYKVTNDWFDKQRGLYMQWLNSF